MKKVLLVAAAVSMLVACNKSGYTISGDVQGFADGTKVYLSKINENELVKVDSTEIKGNVFEFKGEATEIEYSFVQIGGSQQEEPFTVPMILENGDIKVVADKADLMKSKVTGSKNNDDLAKFNDLVAPISKQLQDFQTANNEKFQAAAAANDMQTVQTMMSEMQALQGKMVDEGIKFVDANNESYVSLLLLAQFGQQLSQDEFKAKFNKLSEEVKQTKIGKEISAQLNAPAPVAPAQPTEAPVQNTTPAEANTVAPEGEPVE